MSQNRRNSQDSPEFENVVQRGIVKSNQLSGENLEMSNNFTYSDVCIMFLSEHLTQSGRVFEEVNTFNLYTYFQKTLFGVAFLFGKSVCQSPVPLVTVQ